MITLLLVVGALWGLWRLRSHRKSTYAGLNAEKPTFSALPPVRSLLSRKDFRL